MHGGIQNDSGICRFHIRQSFRVGHLHLLVAGRRCNGVLDFLRLCIQLIVQILRLLPELNVGRIGNSDIGRNLLLSRFLQTADKLSADIPDELRRSGGNLDGAEVSSLSCLCTLLSRKSKGIILFALIGMLICTPGNQILPILRELHGKIRRCQQLSVHRDGSICVSVLFRGLRTLQIL